MSIGTQLKQARENKGISIQEASSKIKIQDKFLQALEGDNISALPNLVYAKGFLKKYAQFLGLDADLLAEELQKAGLPKIDQVVTLKAEELPSLNSQKFFKKVFIGTLAFFVFIGLIVFLFSAHKPSGKARKRPVVLDVKKAKKKTESRAVNRSKKIQIRQAAKSQATRPQAPIIFQKQPSQPQIEIFTLSASAKKPCRISLKADGSLIFDDFLTEGMSQQWKAKKEFELDINDTAAVDLMLNGKRLIIFGRGSKKGILITPEGIKRRRNKS